MSTTSLQKRASIGALAIRKYIGRFEALLFLPKFALGFLRFDANGELQATNIPRTSTNYTADGAISLLEGVHTIAKASAAAMTVAAPSSQDGLRMTIISNTDFAHVITFTGSTLLDGTTGANLTVTMTAFKGSSITVIAAGTKWLLESSSNVTSITA
jgi:hypothetical protein